MIYASFESSSTKLDIINRALAFIGERPVGSSSESQASRLALALLPECLSFVETCHSWYFLYKQLNTNPLSQTVEVTYTDAPHRNVRVNSRVVVHRIYSLRYADPPNYNFKSYACYIDNAAMEAYGTQDMAVGGSSIDYYTVNIDRSITMTPYPGSNVLKQNLELVVYTAIAIVGTVNNDGAKYNIPESAVPLITAQLASLLASRLLNSQETFQFYQAQFTFIKDGLLRAESQKPVNFKHTVL